MRIYDLMIEEMTKRFLSKEDAETIMQKIVNDPSFAGGTMNGRWAEDTSYYSTEPLMHLTWMFVRDVAYAFIEEHYPLAFFKPMFMDHAKLEVYKKENDYEGFLARREEQKQKEETEKAEEKPFTVVGNEKSFSGEYIKNWCRYHIDNETDNKDVAEELWEKYWGEDSDYSYEPNPCVFYYVTNDRTPIGFRQAKLIRDTEKSPKKQFAR